MPAAGQPYRQMLDLKCIVADAEAVLNQRTLCALLDVVQIKDAGSSDSTPADLDSINADADADAGDRAKTAARRFVESDDSEVDDSEVELDHTRTATPLRREPKDKDGRGYGRGRLDRGQGLERRNGHDAGLKLPDNLSKAPVAGVDGGAAAAARRGSAAPSVVDDRAPATSSATATTASASPPSATTTTSKGTVSQADCNVVNCAFQLGRLALTVQHASGRPMVQAVASGLRVHYRDNVYSFGVAVGLSDLVVLDLWRPPVPAMVLAPRYPADRRRLFEFVLHEAIVVRPSASTSFTSSMLSTSVAQQHQHHHPPDNAPSGGASTSTAAATAAAAPTGTTIIPPESNGSRDGSAAAGVVVKRQCKVVLRPIELVLDAPLVTRVADTLAHGQLAAALASSSKPQPQPHTTAQHPAASPGPPQQLEQQHHQQPPAWSNVGGDNNVPDAANYSSYRAYPFSHPSRSSYDLAVLNPLIRIPALIPGGHAQPPAAHTDAVDGGGVRGVAPPAAGASGGDDDTCCLFFNFKHFKVGLRDTHWWRSPGTQQRRLLAEVSAIQLYKLRQRSLLPQNNRVGRSGWSSMSSFSASSSAASSSSSSSSFSAAARRLSNAKHQQQPSLQQQRHDYIFRSAFDVNFRISNATSLSDQPNMPPVASATTTTTVSTDALLEVSEVNVTLTEHWALLLYTTWRTNISRLEFGPPRTRSTDGGAGFGEFGAATASQGATSTSSSSAAAGAAGAAGAAAAAGAARIPLSAEGGAVDKIFTFQFVAPGVSLYLTKPLSSGSTSYSAPLSSARDYRPTKDRGIAVFALRSLDLSVTQAEDTLLQQTAAPAPAMTSRSGTTSAASNDVTVKGTIGNIVFDYLRATDDLSWASSLFKLPSDNTADGDGETEQMPTRLTLLAGELLPRNVTSASQPSRRKKGFQHQRDTGNSNKQNKESDGEEDREDEEKNSDDGIDDDGDDDVDDDDVDDGSATDVDPTVAAEEAAAAAAAITPLVSAEMNVSELKACSIFVTLNAPRLIVAPQAYMVRLGFAGALGHARSRPRV